jgi:phage-related protein
MSDPTYHPGMSGKPRKAFVRLHGEIKTPPFTADGRVEAGTLIGRLQEGEALGMPVSRPMPSVGPGCHELRVRDEGHTWRLVYYADDIAVVLLDVFAKTTRKTPKQVIANCRRRLAAYKQARKDAARRSKQQPRKPQ